MKVAIVFHSVCGNSFLVARAFAEGLKERGHTVGLYRVADEDWVEKADASDAARAVFSIMRELPEALPEHLPDADLVIMGSATYFGNVTAELKAFMDRTGGLWFQGKLIGKKFFAFTSAGNREGGGDLCLQALRTYAGYMGMLTVPLPVRILSGEDTPALGVIHYSAGKYAENLDERTIRLVAAVCDFLITFK